MQHVLSLCTLFLLLVLKTHFANAIQQGAGTDEHALIEILVTRSNEQIHAMNASYQSGEFNTKDAFKVTFLFQKPSTCYMLFHSL